MARSLRNLERLKLRLRSLPAPVLTSVLRANVESADQLMELQRSLVRKDTGALEASIRKEPGDVDGSVRVVAGGETTTREVREGSGVDYDYALAEEFGTERERGQPFFFPAYRSLRKTIKGRAARAAAKAVRDVAAGASSASSDDPS